MTLARSEMKEIGGEGAWMGLNHVFLNKIKLAEDMITLLAESIP